MCDHHHAARDIFYVPNVICWWLCRSLSIARKPPARAAWYNVNHHVGRASPASHGLRAGRVVYAAAGQPVSFYLYESGRHQQRNSAAGNSQRAVYRGLRQPRHLLLLFVQLVPAFCLVTILLLVNRVRMPAGLKAFLARILFHLKTWGMAGDLSLPACW